MNKFIYALLITISWLACDASKNENKAPSQEGPGPEMLGKGLAPSVVKFINDYPMPSKQKENIIKELVKIVKRPFSSVRERESAIEQIVKAQNIDGSFLAGLNDTISKSYPIAPVTPPTKPTVQVNTPKKPAKAAMPGKGGPEGFKSQGNTCFANASLNLLFSSSLIEKLPKNPDPERENFRLSLINLFDARKRNAPLCKPLNDFFETFKVARKATGNSEKVGGNAKIGVDQADAQEFLQDVFNLLELEGPQFSYLVFNDDGKTRMLPPEPDPVIRLFMDRYTKDVSLAALFEQRQLPEALLGADRVLNDAGNKADSDRFQAIFEPPPSSLFIALNRFATDPHPYRAIKLENIIHLSKDLRVKTTDKNDVTKTAYHDYALKVIIVHSGTVDYGHYYAYVFDSTNKEWTKFNDDIVSKVSEASVKKDTEKNGYVFLYEQVK